MYDYKIIRTKRKTLALTITTKKEIIVRAPLLLPASRIKKFVQEHTEWIKKHLVAIDERNKKYPQPEPCEIKSLKEKAKVILGAKTEQYAGIMGVIPTGVKITSAEKRFGSCSAKNSICYSYRLMLYPEDAVDYVVVHELAHIKHKNHSAAFYREIAKVLPDYKRRVKLLK